jgi:glycosyltransferase involved in cell wall biosynthesis
MNVLLATDAFPPVCGGSGWSTFELASGLRRRGHRVLVVLPKPGRQAGVRETGYDDLRVLEFGSAAPNLPYVRNYFKNERLYRKLAAFLTTLISSERVDVIHGQHVLTCVPSVEAARQAGIPSVCTVRDYWPVCYWSDLIYAKDDASLCPGCSAAMMTQCIRPRAGAAWPAALPMIPYMRANLARKRHGLAGAGAVIAVSTAIAADLAARAPEVKPSRVTVIPNPVDVERLRATAAAASRPMPAPYALYLGKLAPNKGTSSLIRIARSADLPWPLVVAGDGPDRGALEAEAAHAGRDVRFTGWIGHDDAVRWLAHAAVLVFPSRGPESLSRVLIEASALGVPIAAMTTGGTPDIVEDERTGLLSTTPDELAADVRRLVDDPALGVRLGAAARPHAEARFDSAAVVARIERVYTDLTRKAATA